MFGQGNEGLNPSTKRTKQLGGGRGEGGGGDFAASVHADFEKRRKAGEQGGVLLRDGQSSSDSSPSSQHPEAPQPPKVGKQGGVLLRPDGQSSSDSSRPDPSSQHPEASQPNPQVQPESLECPQPTYRIGNNPALQKFLEEYDGG